MSIRDYYRTSFGTDIAAVVGDGVHFGATVRHYFGHNWGIDCEGLDRVPEGNRPVFLVCAYFTVLIDQAMHAYHHECYDRFQTFVRYPKFCFGLGQVQKNPCQILVCPIKNGMVTAEALYSVLPDGMRLFVGEVVSFCREHMPEIQPAELFGKLLDDPDVKTPCLRTVPQDVSENTRVLAYQAMSRAVSEWNALGQQCGGAT